MLQGINEDLALPLLTQRPILTPHDRPLPNIKDQIVMVTGAGGSIGSELVRQIARSRPALLVLCDQSEYNLYEISCTLANVQEVRHQSYLVDVRDLRALSDLFHRHKPNVVFHAAALKHVPMLESDFNLVEAVRTNVGGTQNVVHMCVSHGATLVNISTDKAVNPSSSMGLTKRVAEIYAQALQQGQQRATLRTVRFGNVLGSSGSVVPLFRRQIAQGGPVTVTHQDMTRFMMTISEAVGLTLCASSMIDGDFATFILDMGKPIRILDLAVQLISQAGLRPYVDVPITFTGMRPGEKLEEELYYRWERLISTPIEGVMAAVTSYDAAPHIPSILKLIESAEHRDVDRVKQLLRDIVPEYQGEIVF